MSDYRRGADLPLFSALDEPTMPPERPRRPFPPSEPRRTEILPLANAVARKRAGRRERVLSRLQTGPATTWDLMQRDVGGSGFNQRIQELRLAGHRIVCEEHEDGAIYTLVLEG